MASRFARLRAEKRSSGCGLRKYDFPRSPMWTKIVSSKRDSPTETHSLLNILTY